MTPGVDQTEVAATAERMLSRYTSAKVAAEMAFWHSQDYKPGMIKRAYWEAVREEIRRQGHLRY